MGRPPNKLQAWQGDRWSPVVGKAIERRLRLIRPKLAELTALREPGEVDALIEELAVELRRCWSKLRDRDLAYSDPVVRQWLTKYVELPENKRPSIWEADPSTRGIVEDCLENNLFIEDVSDKPDLVLEAAKRALEGLAGARRGRPKGSDRSAYRHIGQELAVIYQKFSLKNPSRVVDPADSSESGPYKEFVETVVSILPGPLKKYKSAQNSSISKSVDHLVRIGIDHFKTTSKPPR